MPKKIGKPLVKTEEEKAEDKKLLQEINSERQEEGPDDFDPLEFQAKGIPTGIKGSEGDKPHVAPIGGEEAPAGSVQEEDEDFDSNDDPDTLTA